MLAHIASCTGIYPGTPRTCQPSPAFRVVSPRARPGTPIPMSIHHTRTGKWEVRYREGRRNRSKTFDLQEDARSFEAEARVRRQRGEHVRRSTDTPTLRDFAADWIDRRRAAGLSEATLKTNGLIFRQAPRSLPGGIEDRRPQPASPRRVAPRTGSRRRQHLHAQPLEDSARPDPHGRQAP